MRRNSQPLQVGACGIPATSLLPLRHWPGLGVRAASVAMESVSDHKRSIAAASALPTAMPPIAAATNSGADAVDVSPSVSLIRAFILWISPRREWFHSPVESTLRRSLNRRRFDPQAYPAARLRRDSVADCVSDLEIESTWWQAKDLPSRSSNVGGTLRGLSGYGIEGTYQTPRR